MNNMPLGFHENAIVLSGETGTQLKSSILRDYYPLWWYITSGGPSRYHRNNTSIIEMHAATGEVYIPESDETFLGSAGHALQLKHKNGWNTRNLKVICVEDNDDCYDNLKEVIKRRWPSTSIENSEGSIEDNTTNVFLIHAESNEAIDKILQINGMGNSIFFFDPLLNVEWDIIDRIARNRITSYHKTGTEFIVFMFTSDWYKGRNVFSPLPTIQDEERWSAAERQTVEHADNLFGNQKWRRYLLTDSPNEEKEQLMVYLYCINLFNWFRYVLPLPFKPKKDQLYHLFFCSNYEAGINITKRYYQEKTGNDPYAPENKVAFSNFKKLHPEVFKGIKHPRRPLPWKTLWKIIKSHEFGICDPMCRDFIAEESDFDIRVNTLEWLEKNEYLSTLKVTNPLWDESFQRYILNWDNVTKNLEIEPPRRLEPIEPAK